ncbi:MAG: GTPase HflX [Opitutia bacterium]
MSTAAPLPSPIDPQDPKVRERLGRAFLVGLQRPEQDARESLSLLEELRELVGNLGIEVRGDLIARLREEHPRHLVGSGKMEEVAALARGLDCGLVVFDDALTPAQQRNWEKDAPGLRVIDRQEVILDIFAARAKTREAVLQVELARLQQQLPRLRRLWSHLDRQRGGGAMQRDAGETQLEMDQRGIREKIARVRRELDEVVRQRATQRKQRQRVPVPTFAIVGYTNAGKSSLLNRLTGAEVLAADRLFATLDPTTRRLTLPSGRALLLTDTVGFVRRLPHRLVEAFKATLEESVQADVLLHVVDLASPDAAAHAETTLGVLGEVGAGDRPVLTVLNKADLVTDPLARAEALARHPGAILVSAHTGEGVPELLAELDRLASQGDRRLRLLIPHERYDLVAKLHGAAAILSERATDGGVELEALVPARLLEAAAPFAQKVAT